MKKLILLFSVLISVGCYCQNDREYEIFIQQLKSNAIPDKNDLTVYRLLDDFYEQVLQADNGELNEDIPLRIEQLYSDENTKNLHIFYMFMAYQQHISHTAGLGINPDSKFQVRLMTDLENEIKATYGKVPVIIKIYKAEAFNSNRQYKEYSILLAQSLSEFPDSIPLKVYSYLDTNDEKIKADLLKNHSNHWMVKDYLIK